MKPIAICETRKVFDHYTSWTPRFVEYCEEAGILYELVDCYSTGIVPKLDRYSALIWNYSNYVISDLLEARNIIQVAESLGLVCFPSQKAGWHFDDKIAEMYAFQSVNAPIPESWVFYMEDECVDWLRGEAKYPLVAKLRCGSGANNVKLLNNEREAVAYAHRMFSGGYNPTPSIAYKAYSKLQSSRDLRSVVSRVQKIPQFLNTRRHARMMPQERGYCYVQAFVPNKGFDLKVVVVNGKMTFCSRDVRKNDFRASGGGAIAYNRSLLTDEVIDSAYAVADALCLDCVGFDYVVDCATGKGAIVEMCYGFDWQVQRDLGAWVDCNHVWHEEAVIVPDEIVKLIVDKIGEER